MTIFSLLGSRLGILALALVAFAGLWWYAQGLKTALEAAEQARRQAEAQLAAHALVGEMTAAVAAQKAQSEAKAKIVYRTIVKEIDRAPNSAQCLASAPVRAALDGLRKHHAPDRAARDPAGDPAVQGASRGARTGGG